MVNRSEENRKKLTPEVLSQLAGLELRARRIVEGYVSGLHRSPFQGFSVEFSEHREYTPGDDLRYVDWKLFGKTERVYLKRFEEETNLVCYLLLDVSESMQYQSNTAMSKQEYAQCVAAALSFLVLRQNDSVGLATFDSQLREMVRPSSSSSHWQQLINVIEQHGTDGKTNCGPILGEVAQRWNQRGIVVVVSDFLDDVNSIISGLQHLHHRKHDVIVVHVVDPAEVDFPFEQVTQFQGLEDLGNVLADPRSVKRAYQKEFNAFQRQISAGCRSVGADYLLARTDQPLDKLLTTYLSRRAKRTK